MRVSNVNSCGSRKRSPASVNVRATRPTPDNWGTGVLPNARGSDPSVATEISEMSRLVFMFGSPKGRMVDGSDADDGPPAPLQHTRRPRALSPRQVFRGGNDHGYPDSQRG